ncbi:MAG: EVE domain-containing protein [Bacteroidetes bacterium]|nr:EVE domain-containing protein [Bacteroidota bacterium]
MYWLVKSDPETYGWEQFQKDKITSWDGVRNYAARIHLRAMKTGDDVLFYHSNTDAGVVGTAKVTKESYPDPTAKEEGWVSVELKCLQSLKSPVTLKAIKAEKKLQNMVLIKISRLSVSPVTQEEYDTIIKMGGH